MGGSREKKMQRGSDVVTMSTGQALREREGWLGGWVGRAVWEGEKTVRCRRGKEREKINLQVTRGAASSHKDCLQPRHFSSTASPVASKPAQLSLSFSNIPCTWKL